MTGLFELAARHFPGTYHKTRQFAFIPIISILAAFPYPSVGAQMTAPAPLTPEFKKIVESNTDILGEEALRQPEGPSYSFFAKIAPPLLYVNTDFHYYPIVLGVSNAQLKARIASNGSAANPRANSGMWHDEGIPVSFKVGGDGVPFGGDRARLDGPHLADRCLPIAQMSYLHDQTTYTEEAFVPVADPYAKYAAVMLRFATEGGNGILHAVVEKPKPAEGKTGMEIGPNVVCDLSGRGLAWFGSTWKWDNETSTLVTQVSPQNPAFLVVLTEPAYETPVTPNARQYEDYRAQCVQSWSAILARGTQIEVAEPMVNDAWRATILGNYMLIKGDDMNYSAGNNYEKLYAAEGSDAVRSLLLFGQLRDGRRLLPPVMDYWRKNLTFHQAAQQLQLFASYYWLTRDMEFLREQRPRWSREVNEILAGREKETGLLPRERYAGDISTQVLSLSSNSNCWRGLRDMAAVLDDASENDEARPLMETAGEYRKAILAATEKSVYRDFKPPFVPVAFFGEERPYEHLTQTHVSAYYDLMIPYVLGSGVFPSGSEFETDILRTLQERGGICEGMVRTHGENPMYAARATVNSLYTLRYTQALLQRDESDLALVSFYGKLGQAMSPDTFYSGEASGIAPYDKDGRGFYLPPNSAGNAFYLWMLRYMLVQDWDMNDDGKPETLRLLFATPREWLREGAKIKVERAPTAFGEVSLNVESHLAKGEVLATIKAPPRVPDKTLLRIRLPEGKKVSAAHAGKASLAVDDKGTVDISKLKGEFTVRFDVK